MKYLFLLLSFVLIFTGCVSPSEPKVTYDETACTGRVRDSLVFASNTMQTRMFFTDFVSNPGMEMDRFFDVLGKNVSSALLAMKDPYSQQVSLRLNPDMDAFSKALNKRLFSGGSLIEMQDVVGMTMQDEFLRVDIAAPDIVSGYFYIICKEIEGRTLAEQTFLDYSKPNQGRAKMSIEALIGLLL